jgi:hypothetical protein
METRKGIKNMDLDTFITASGRTYSAFGMTPDQYREKMIQLNAHAFLGDFYNFLDKNDTNTWKDRVVCGKGVNEEATKVIQEHLTYANFQVITRSPVVSRACGVEKAIG